MTNKKYGEKEIELAQKELCALEVFEEFTDYRISVIIYFPEAISQTSMPALPSGVNENTGEFCKPRKEDRRIDADGQAEGRQCWH